MNEQLNLNKKFIIKCTIDWCDALIIQGNRLLSELNYTPKFNVNFQTKHTLGMMVECSFFVYSLDQTLLYSILTQDLCDIKFDFVKEFSTQDIKDVRNMTVHADKYLSSNGHFQDRFVHMTDNKACDATSIIWDEYGPQIGNRLNVKKTMADSQKLLIELKKLDENTEWD